MKILPILAAMTQDMKDALSNIPGNSTDPNSGIASGKFIGTLLNWSYAAAGLIAVAFIVYGAINYIMTQGDPGKIKQAGQTIAFAVIGLIVVLLAAAITNFIMASTSSTNAGVSI